MTDFGCELLTTDLGWLDDSIELATAHTASPFQSALYVHADW